MTLLLAASIGLTLVMLTVDSAFGEQLDDVRDQVGSEIEVRPAGAFGGGFAFAMPVGGNGELPELPTIADADVERIATLDGVDSIERKLTHQWQSESLNNEVQLGAPGAQNPGQTVELPITINGIETPNLDILGGGVGEITSGRLWNQDELHANVAVVGQTLAEKNELSVGSTFDVEGIAVEVIGIFSSGQQFGDGMIFMPTDTVQHLFDKEDSLSEAVVIASDADDAERLADDIRELLGVENVDVVTASDRVANIAGPLSDAGSSSQIGLIAALVASAVVIVLSVGLVTRQRVKEMGILKAVGASNPHVVGQFGVETLVMSLVAAVIGGLLTFPAAQRVADGLIDEPQMPGFTTFSPAGGDQVAGEAPVAFSSDGAIGGLFDSVSVAVSPEVFVYALGLAIALALVASVIPAWYVARVKPAEVLRYE